MISKQQLGASGELRARRYLEVRGYQFVTANYRTRFGEIDLVMRDGETLVFVEVKTRRGSAQGYPEEAVDARKLNQVIRLATSYCQTYRIRSSWRIDVIAIGQGIRHLQSVTL